MYIRLLLPLALLFTVFAQADAQEQAVKFDSAAARERFAGSVSDSSGPMFTKGIDPVIKRVYTKDAVSVFRRSGAIQTKPLVELPLLFRKNTDELLDEVSRANVAEAAQILRELSAQGKGFSIEGHASAEGNFARNQELSRLRALRLQTLLREAGVPAAVMVRTEGFGSAHAQHPADAPESLLQADRRVLLVQEK